MKCIWFFIPLIFALVIPDAALAQYRSERGLSGKRSIEITEINRINLENHFMIVAKDSISKKELIILSEKFTKKACGGNESIYRLEANRFYTLELMIYPDFPFNVDADTLDIMFDSRTVEVSYSGISFSKDNPPYYSEAIIRDNVCLHLEED